MFFFFSLSHFFLVVQISDLEKELVELKAPSAQDVSKVLESYQNQVRIRIIIRIIITIIIIS